MRQYLDAKQQHRDAILFFRMGDFYEMFYEDALVAARALELTLTSRSKDANGGGIPMCGVPFHAVDGYIARLVKKGFRVAICDQVEDPRKAKGLVKREVVRVVSPGTLTDASYLDAREPAFLMARRTGAARSGAGRPTIGVALLDLSTGEFTAAEYHGAGRPAGARRRDRACSSRARSSCPPTSTSRSAGRCAVASAVPVTPVDAWTFDGESARRALLDQLRTGGLEGFGLEAHRPRRWRPPARSCSISAPRRRSISRTCAPSGYRERARHAAHRSDDAQAPRDRRRLRGRPRRLAARRARSHGHVDRQPAAPVVAARPLVALEPIRDRLDAVEELAFRTTERGKFRETLKAVQDLERLVARAALGTAGPRDFRRPEAVAGGHPARPHRARRPAGAARPLARRRSSTTWSTCGTRSSARSSTMPPALARDGGVIRDGVDAELDELRDDQPIGQAGHRRDGRRASARAPASRR